MLDNIDFFSDLDDTISSNRCLFFSKLKLIKKLKWFKKNKSFYFKIVFNSFEINKNFLKIVKDRNIKEVFILSRNDNDFVLYFVKQFNKMYSKKYWFKIKWWIWGLNTDEKIKFFKNNSIMISDIFEYKKLNKHKNFISVDKYNIFKKNYIYTKKVFLLILFLFKNLWLFLKK